ncbi:hypothetical protein BDN71DRAFT_1511085 [Pleurotus eryngii]|uniref:Uncharacterized protein n=1 Tax=Pleurotus eryngii TaxID=5323 RepID=A0A9P5ZQ65_PLEER|nr:hypothetical protein BDN71DRAFT_1511085 [Pleurotus eryngii]
MSTICDASYASPSPQDGDHDDSHWQRHHDMGVDNQSGTMSASNPAGYSDGESITRDDVDYAREILEAVGYNVEEPSGTTEDENQTRASSGTRQR